MTTGASQVRFVWKNVMRVHQGLENIEKNRVKAARTAAKVEGFRLMKKLTREIRAGSPGGRAYDPLTVISRRRAGRFTTRKPFTRLFSTRGARGTRGTLPVRYRASKEGGNYTVQVGFVSTYRETLSASWQRILKKQQEGFTLPVTDIKRRILIRMGATLSKRSKLKKFFFLKKSTRSFKIPARPIIDPFWNANREEARKNITLNWEKKMKGERI